jgi:hypothetical protein
MSLASPGVRVKEVDFTARINVADQNIGVVSIAAEKGPTDSVTYISSERELVEIFGKPNKYNYESWFAANTLLQYGAVVAVIRPGTGTSLGLSNSNIKSDDSSDTSLLIGNIDQFETTADSAKTYQWAARTAGSNFNGISVAVVDHGSDQRLTVTPAAGQVDTVDTVGAADASRTAGTYTIGASDYSAAGSGVGATFSIVVNGSGAATVTITTKGSGYAVDDTITVTDANLGGGGGANLTFDVATVGASLPVAGTYFTWGSSGAKGNVYKTIGNDTIEVTLWDSTKRLTGTEALKDASNNTIATVTAVTSNDTYGELEYAIGSGKKWSSLAPQPGTSNSVSEAGGKYDEFHIVVVDTDGVYSGQKNGVMETLSYVSKSTDAKSAEGDTKYWKTVVTNSSSFIYPGNESFVAASDELALAGQSGTASSINSPQLNATFKLFSFATVGDFSRKLASGSDYSWSTQESNINDATVNGYDLVKDPEVFGDIDFLVPGKITASAVTRLIAIAELRRDCIVVASPERLDVINSNTSTKKTDDIVSFFKTLPSTSFAIYDSGYKYIYDKYNDVYRYVPCAADVAGICLSTTINSETWFSPAGYNRGQIRNATKLAYSPRQAERDRLYTNRVNPIVAFPGQGIVLFGDKTALATPSAFDRINVRRLFTEIEKNIAEFSKYQLFEINDELTRSGFRSAIEPYLRGIQGRRGIYDFLVVCDTSNNTGDVIDRNELVAEIFIKPARSINFITISFVATRTGVSFNELIS